MEDRRLYEGMFLFDANLATRDWPGLERHVQELLAKHEAELVYGERWPDRKLAYEIRGCKKGTYYLTYFRAPPHAIAGIRKDSQLSERILRVLILYDEALVEDCEKRLRREIYGSPEEIEAERQRRLGLAPSPGEGADLERAPAESAAAGSETPEFEEPEIRGEPEAPEVSPADREIEA